MFPGSALIAAADFAVDVGRRPGPATGRFHHHQKGFDCARPSGVVSASAGLV
ncbi:MAG: MYG1 family protein [Gammaproteobacteria bacterium]